MSFKLFPPPPHLPLLAKEQINKVYQSNRTKVFLGIFIGYAGYYLVRKNFSLAMPDLIAQGYSKAELGLALSGVSIAYGISKFLMGNVSDRSNARTFLTVRSGVFSLDHDSDGFCAFRYLIHRGDVYAVVHQRMVPGNGLACLRQGSGALVFH